MWNTWRVGCILPLTYLTKYNKRKRGKRKDKKLFFFLLLESAPQRVESQCADSILCLICQIRINYQSRETIFVTLLLCELLLWRNQTIANKGCK
uniref:Uncharacterized protein n=1 Tax=Rhizophagus irregularis (strain DAOM 181602 / DAOM 197198 / MUCL 43194) TaxID=747089 RepID=U9TM43_RHIID